MEPRRGGTPHLSIVIPARDEEKRLEGSLLAVFDYFRGRGADFEVLVVDDGSTDGTARLAERRMLGERGRVLRNAENRGKGYSVRRGFLESAGRWVLMTDADLSTPIEEYDKLSRAARDRDLDIVIGSRALAESRIEVRQSRVRETMGKTFNLFVRLLTGLEFADTQCGFKLLDRRRALPLFERMVIDRFAFDVELLFLAVRFGLRVADVPVVWRNAERSKVRMWRDPPDMLLDLLRVRWRFRRGLYNPSSPPGGAENPAAGERGGQR